MEMDLMSLSNLYADMYDPYHRKDLGLVFVPPGRVDMQEIVT